ncbi:MAG: hypothetical protein ACRDVZ_06405 [Jiangellaceae bacterium]
MLRMDGYVQTRARRLHRVDHAQVVGELQPPGDSDRAQEVDVLAGDDEAGVAIAPADRTVPSRAVLRPDPELVASLDPVGATDFADTMVVVWAETLRRICSDV